MVVYNQNITGRYFHGHENKCIAGTIAYDYESITYNREIRASANLEG